jgi:chromosome segregation ATPase
MAAPGDSGSWVIGDGQLYGHIVAAKGSVPWAYMIAFDSILADIRRSMNTNDVYLPTSADIIAAGMRDALLQTQRRIKQTTTGMHQFMLSIEDRPAAQVDLKPQITWLSGRITALIADLSCAEEKAKDAMTQTMNYATVVNDAAQEIQVQECELIVAQEKGEELTTRAQQQLRNSETLVREKESCLEQKKRDITAKSGEATSLRGKLTGYLQEVADNERKLAEARSKAQDKKEKAIAGFVRLLNAWLQTVEHG